MAQAGSKVFEDETEIRVKNVKARQYRFFGVVSAESKITLATCERRIVGIDDPVYEKNLRNVWEQVPRGHVRVFELPGVTQESSDSSSNTNNQGTNNNNNNNKKEDKKQKNNKKSRGGKHDGTSGDDEDSDNDNNNNNKNTNTSASAAAAAASASSGPSSPNNSEAIGGSQTEVLPENAILRGEIFGMHKFGYGNSKYGYRDKIDTCICIEKLNGECAHISACVVGCGDNNNINKNKQDQDQEEESAASATSSSQKKKISKEEGHRCWIVGSKHCHIIIADAAIDNEGDFTRTLTTCYGDQRYMYASKIAKVFQEMITKKVSRENRELFLNTLIEKGWTANAEAILAEEQHLVDYEGANELRFFSLTRRGRTVNGLCIPVEESFEFFKKLDLPHARTMPRVKYQSDDYNKQIDHVAKSTNYEGVVVYGSSPDGRVCCVWKEKSYPYIMERIAREAITQRYLIGPLLQAYLLKRLAGQSDELRKHFAEWETKRLPFLVSFASFCCAKGYFKEMNASQMRARWLKLQKEFEQLPEQEMKLLEQKATSMMKKAPRSDRDIIMFVAPPGAGKSSLARALRYLLNKLGFENVEWINQDECNGKRQMYLNQIKAANEKDSKVSHLILDKSNMMPENRRDYDDLGFSPTMTVLISHPEGAEELANVCIDRVTKRGLAHRSLTVQNENAEKDIALARKIITSMLEGFDDSLIEHSFAPGSCVKLDVTASLVEQLKMVYCSGLQKLSCKELPDVTEKQLKEAVDKSNAYEKNLSRK